MTTRPPGSRWAVTLDVETGIPDDGGVYQFDVGGIHYAFFVPRPVLDSLPADRIARLPDPEPEHDVHFTVGRDGDWRWNCFTCDWAGFDLISREGAEREHAREAKLLKERAS